MNDRLNFLSYGKLFCGFSVKVLFSRGATMSYAMLCRGLFCIVSSFFYLSRNISAVLVSCTRSWCPLKLDLTPTQIQMTTLVLKFGISCRSLLTSHGYQDDCRLNMVALTIISTRRKYKTQMGTEICLKCTYDIFMNKEFNSRV